MEHVLPFVSILRLCNMASSPFRQTMNEVKWNSSDQILLQKYCQYVELCVQQTKALTNLNYF